MVSDVQALIYARHTSRISESSLERQKFSILQYPDLSCVSIMRDFRGSLSSLTAKSGGLTTRTPLHWERVHEGIDGRNGF